MNKNKIATVILTGIFVLGMGTEVMAKTPAKAPAAVSNPVVQEDGRNTNGIGTAQITFSPITGYYGSEQVVFGEVVIDGAREDLANLYVTVGGNKVSNVWAISGQTNTYGFSATVSLYSHALTSLEVKAETLFHNGQKAGLVHSNNSSTVNVDVLPVITEYVVSYGAENDTPVFVWDEENKTYSLTFTVEKKLSNGDTEKETITLSGLAADSTVSYKSDEFNDENYFGQSLTLIDQLAVPAAPAVPGDETVTVTRITDIVLSLVSQGRNQFKVLADYTIIYSNGTTKPVYAVTLPGGNISNPDTQNQNSPTREYLIEGIKYDVTVEYNSNTDTYSASGIKK